MGLQQGFKTGLEAGFYGGSVQALRSWQQCGNECKQQLGGSITQAGQGGRSEKLLAAMEELLCEFPLGQPRVRLHRK
jgi:hypothetical protein